MKKVLIVTVAAGLVLMGHFPLAAQQDETPQDTVEPIRQEYSEARGLHIRERCSTLKDKISRIHENAALRQEKSDSLMRGWRSKLDELAQRAEAAGLDVAKLKSDLVELGRLSGTLSADWGSFRDALDSVVQGAVCGDLANLDARTLHDEIESARDIRGQLRESFQDVRSFNNTVIKTDLAELRQQISQLNAASEGEN